MLLFFVYYYWFVCSVFSLTSGTNTLPYFNNKHNRPFPSSLVPLFQNESKSETFHVKISSAYSFIHMQIKVIFIKNGFALRFALKQRHKGTRKWPIHSAFYLPAQISHYQVLTAIG